MHLPGILAELLFTIFDSDQATKILKGLNFYKELMGLLKFLPRQKMCSV